MVWGRNYCYEVRTGRGLGWEEREGGEVEVLSRGREDINIII